MFRKSIAFGVVATALAASSGARGASDPVDDFLPTYTGAHSGDLDITSVSARFDGTNFLLDATLNGPVGSSPGSLFVWGINRGAGIPRLNALSTPALDPTVLWDSLAVLLPDGTLRVVTFPPAGAPTIIPIAGGTVVNGNSISAAVPFALLPTRGFDPSGYTFQLWSRLRVNPAADGFNSEVADFGPRLFASVPEPASWGMMLAGFGAAGLCARRRRRSFA